MSELQVRGGLFSEGRNTNSPKLVERPQGRGYAGGGQAVKVTVPAETVIWGLSASGGLCCEEYQGHTAVRWNEGGLCGLMKRDPHGASCLIFKALNCYEFSNIYPDSIRY
jgi:hypothetical protein